MNALAELIAAEKDARDYGFTYPDAKMILDQVIDECREVSESIEQQESQVRQQEEIADLIHAAIALCYHQGFDVEETVSLAAKKFTNRMQIMKSIAADEGIEDMHNLSLEEKLRFWKAAKLG